VSGFLSGVALNGSSHNNISYFTNPIVFANNLLRFSIIQEFVSEIWNILLFSNEIRKMKCVSEANK